ncbi:MAG: Periplasmic (Fe) hydrogenase large subunit [Deltaproteobacteria bacterium ADurb.Bin510]|nr:MAG: Periplasmic (Fe) hydrogenase large subunit [Deltaproteobacteria bacterium ADurb.Bin510]
MEYRNNATRLRREVLIRLAEAYDELETRVDRIPYAMRPLSGEYYRCCVYKDRAILRYRVIAALGFALEDDEDDFTPLKEYAARALERQKPAASDLTVLELACKGCVQAHYQVTDACLGCVARPCQEVCPFKAVTIREGRSIIDPKLCRSCGKCQQVCPYHAITRIPVPCEEACPVGAIHKSGSGKATIDHAACISCGRCLRECPFGAVMERSQIIDVLGALKSGREVVALLAPAVAGQFPGTYGQLVTALIGLNFAAVYEVAEGAVATAVAEAEEFRHKLAAGQSLMTTSCCPAYVAAVDKHLPELKPLVSDTPSPMIMSARQVASERPQALKVFIGPCIAKKQEARLSGLIDYVLNFEELGAMLVGHAIQVEDCIETRTEQAGALGQGFALAGGVAAAVQQLVGEAVRPVGVAGLESKTMKLLGAYARGRCPGNLLEVMACPGGCVGGPGTVVSPSPKRPENRRRWPRRRFFANPVIIHWRFTPDRL